MKRLLSRYLASCDSPTVIPVRRLTRREIYIITGKQAAAVSQGVNCFMKRIIMHSDGLTDGGNKVCGFRYACAHVSKAKYSFSLMWVNLFRCLLSSSLERDHLENCERKVKLRANNLC